MKVVIPAETKAGERRVAMVPSVVKKMTGLGFDVMVESGA
ncbi:MAG: Alanine dehydrogenase/PNT, N-terminal domain, partial [Actinomycetota bacterium]